MPSKATVSITVLPANEPLNFQYIHSENLNRYFQLNYNTHISPYDYQKHLERLYETFKEAIQKRFTISKQQFADLEKLSEFKSVISEIYNRFHLTDNDISDNTQYPVHFKMDTIVNLKQVLFSLSLQNEINKFQFILQSYLSIQYQFLKDALDYIENKIELLKYSIDNSSLRFYNTHIIKYIQNI